MMVRLLAAGPILRILYLLHGLRKFTVQDSALSPEKENTATTKQWRQN
jgi:hypothetical protein